LMGKWRLFPCLDGSSDTGPAARNPAWGDSLEPDFEIERMPEHAQSRQISRTSSPVRCDATTLPMTASWPWIAMMNGGGGPLPSSCPWGTSRAATTGGVLRRYDATKNSPERRHSTRGTCIDCIEVSILGKPGRDGLVGAHEIVKSLYVHFSVRWVLACRWNGILFLLSTLPRTSKLR